MATTCTCWTCSDKKHQFVKKYDRHTGKLIWTSPEIKDAKAIPGMYVVDDKVLLQVGGIVETQAYVVLAGPWPMGPRSVVEEWRVQYKNVKPCGVQAFNTSDGSLAWDSERFKKGITNMLHRGQPALCLQRQGALLHRSQDRQRHL